MGRRGEEAVDRRGLDVLPGIHDVDGVADFIGRAQVVRGQQHGDVAFGRQAADQAENLRLNGDVERRGGFVGDHQVRTGQQRHRDHQPLALAAGELVRILAQHLVRPRQLHGIEQLQDRVEIRRFRSAG